MVDTNNPLWGRTVNPRDPSFTPGGSTGGEAALLAMHGSLVGWGTDIGGSIRTPSSMMGLYGLKPSVGVSIFVTVTLLMRIIVREAWSIAVSQYVCVNGRPGTCPVRGRAHGTLLALFDRVDQGRNRCGTLGS